MSKGSIAKIYYELVKNGKRKIDEVPLNIRNEVEMMLDEKNSEQNNNDI